MVEGKKKEGPLYLDIDSHSSRQYSLVSITIFDSEI